MLRYHFTSFAFYEPSGYGRRLPFRHGDNRDYSTMSPFPSPRTRARHRGHQLQSKPIFPGHAFQSKRLNRLLLYEKRHGEYFICRQETCPQTSSNKQTRRGETLLSNETFFGRESDIRVGPAREAPPAREGEEGLMQLPTERPRMQLLPGPVRGTT